MKTMEFGRIKSYLNIILFILRNHLDKQISDFRSKVYLPRQRVKISSLS